MAMVNALSEIGKLSSFKVDGNLCLTFVIIMCCWFFLGTHVLLETNQFMSATCELEVHLMS